MRITIRMVVAAGCLAALVGLEAGCAERSTLRVEEPQLSPSTGESQPALVIRGEKDKVYDFSDRVLAGSSQDTPPDQRAGVGVLIENCENVTIRGATVRGYKIGILVRNSSGVRIENCDVSDNWMQRLKSQPEKEDLADWMSFHHNEKREWMRFGAGIYLEDCDYPVVTGCIATRGQNGLLMTRVSRGLVHSNAFTFLSGLGIGMYRSSQNAIMHNKLDYCVRGYSHGVYSRGQDSAAILVYESSHRNLFAYNSATHSGDGFFLWAGQTTMDSGWGGCNDNVVFGNDFSYAPTNGIENTFARNYFIANQLDGCDYGIWGGYSYDSLFLGNSLGGNRTGIAIEHGQDNAIVGNVMAGNRLPIRLWANPPERQDPKWGYPKHRDTRSRDTLIASNRITAPADLAAGSPAISLARARGVKLAGNEIDGRYQPVRADGASEVAVTRGEETRATPLPLEVEAWRPRQIKGAIDPFSLRPDFCQPRQQLFVEDRSHIRMLEWGPWSGVGPALFRLPRKDGKGPYVFELLGPEGQWGVVEVQGGSWRREEDHGVKRLVVEPTEAGAPLKVAVMYRGRGATVDQWGRWTQPGEAQVLRWEEPAPAPAPGKK